MQDKSVLKTATYLMKEDNQLTKSINDLPLYLLGTKLTETPLENKVGLSLRQYELSFEDIKAMKRSKWLSDN